MKCLALRVSRASSLNYQMTTPIAAEESVNDLVDTESGIGAPDSPFNRSRSCSCGSGSSTDSDSDSDSDSDNDDQKRKQTKDEKESSFNLNYADYHHESAYTHFARPNWHKPTTSKEIVRYCANAYESSGMVKQKILYDKSSRAISITKEIRRVIMEFAKLLYSSHGPDTSSNLYVVNHRKIHLSIASLLAGWYRQQQFIGFDQDDLDKLFVKDDDDSDSDDSDSDDDKKHVKETKKVKK